MRCVLCERWCRLVWSFIALVLLSGGGYPAESEALGAASSGAATSNAIFGGEDSAAQPLRLLASTMGYVTVELSIPSYELEDVEVDGHPFVRIHAAGLDDSADPGKPRLPQAGALIGLPPTGGWSVRILESESEVISLPRSMAPAPSLVQGPERAVVAGFGTDPEQAASEGMADQAILTDLAVLIDRAVYEADSFYPASPVEVVESSLLRDLRIIRLGLYPFSYNPVLRELVHMRRLVVQVRFDEAVPGRSQPPGPWDAVMEQAVLNYDVARNWRGVRPEAPDFEWNALAARPGSYKVEVDADGLYQLTYEELQAAGFPVSTTKLENLHLVAGGQEAALHLQTGSDGQFTPGDRILFYGQAARGRYTDVNVYWLYSDEAPGQRMGYRSVTPLGNAPVPLARWVTSHFEEDDVYDGYHAEPSGDHWFWADLRHLETDCWTGGMHTETFTLTQLWAGAHHVTFRISLQGFSFGSHKLRVSLNGNYVGSVEWADYNRTQGQFTFSATWLRQGRNELQLENGACPPPPPPSPPPNGMELSSFEIDHLAGYQALDDQLDFKGEAGSRQYELVGFTTANQVLYDITDPSAPVSLTGGRVESGSRLVFEDYASSPRCYLAAAQGAIRHPRSLARDQSSSLGSSSAGADYLVIGYGTFLPAMQPLIELRAWQGQMMMSVDVQDIFDEFSYGLLDPSALQVFLAYVAAEWNAVPDYVLLVGDGTIDYHDNWGNGWRNYVPAYPAMVDLRLGPKPAETASDNELDPGTELPMFQMGRLPVVSPAETQAVVQKIMGYEVAPVPGAWNRHLVFAAGNPEPGDPVFASFLEAIYESLPERLVGDRVYLAAEPSKPYEYDSDVPAEWVAARTTIQDRLVAGRLLAIYMGHSSFSQWARQILLHRDQVPSLQNHGRLPVVLSMTCYTSAFHHPKYDPLDERLILQADGGAVATWGATGAGVATGHRHLAQGFVDAVTGESSVTLGAAAYAGLALLYTEAPTNRDLINTFVLFGDPAMPVNRYESAIYEAYVPLALKGQ